jgi:EAL domain-containing protein (putative c-di-GMP-specific phosphodiesterase class I)
MAPETARPAAAAAVAITSDDLRSAIANEQIDAHVQPKIGLRDRRLAGVQALARWFRRGADSVFPDQFIPLAEASGQIDALTDLVLRRALRSCGEWSRAGVRTRIAIKFSGVTLAGSGVAERLVAIAAEAGVEPRQIVAEISEASLRRNLPAAYDGLAQLHRSGVALSVNDFGLGEAALAPLQALRVDELTIDRKFIAAMMFDRRCAEVVEASIRLARKRGIGTVTAQGVETAAQLEHLARLGCDYAQGYHIALPFPAAELPDWARKNTSV